MRVLACALLVIAAAYAAEERCEPGKRFNDYCNTCMCPSDGNAENAPCTRMGCGVDIWNKDGTLKNPKGVAASRLFREKREVDLLCQPDKTFKSDCNTCLCSLSGDGALCTVMSCPPRPADAVDQVCDPGNSFDLDCNQCICSEDGLKIFCTKKACDVEDELNFKRFAPVAEKGTYCEPNTSFAKDCNTCVCNDYGTEAVCTLKACL